MTFHLTDPDGDRLTIEPADRDDGTPVVHLDVTGGAVHIPLDRIEEVVRGLRETAREAAPDGTEVRP